MTKHVMLELSTAHLSGETLDALNMGSIESVISYDKTVGWLGTVGYFVLRKRKVPIGSCLRATQKR